MKFEDALLAIILHGQHITTNTWKSGAYLFWDNGIKLEGNLDYKITDWDFDQEWSLSNANPF